MSFKVIQGHRFWYQSKAHRRLPVIKKILIYILCRTVSKLSQIIVQIWYKKRLICFFDPPLGDLWPR